MKSWKTDLLTGTAGCNLPAAVSARRRFDDAEHPKNGTDQTWKLPLWEGIVPDMSGDDIRSETKQHRVDRYRVAQFSPSIYDNLSSLYFRYKN